MFVQKLGVALAILAITYHVNASPEARLITSNLPQDRIIDLELSEPEVRESLEEAYERFRYVDIDREIIQQIISGEKPTFLVEFFDGVTAKVQINNVVHRDFAAFESWNFQARLFDFPGNPPEMIVGSVQTNDGKPTLHLDFRTEDGLYKLTAADRRGTQVVAKQLRIGKGKPECGIVDSGPITEEQITQALHDQRTAYQEYQQRVIYDPDNPSPERIARIQGVLKMWHEQPELRKIAEDELMRLGVDVPKVVGKQ